MKKQSGFAVVESVVIVLVIAVIAVVGFYVWNGRKTSSDSAAATNVKQEKTTAKNPSSSISYVKAEEPAGWSESHQQGSHIYGLANDQLGCYVSVGLDRPKMDLSSVQPLPSQPHRDVTLGSGQKVTLYEGGTEKGYEVSSGYLVGKIYDAPVTVACKDVSNYQQADLALKAIKLNVTR
ncbi:MAG TPA: hypothetical protein VFL85_00770 [Candidatus Saccharimonadales bacterium]|nr:hypothetical protein [Candidatus Saccharimonadales bacterium]